MYNKIIYSELLSASDVLKSFLKNTKNINNIELAANLIVKSFLSNNKVISCGNGGSHCDAMHFAEELTGKYRNKRSAYPALCISDVSHFSCVSNDYGYEFVFSRYIEALGQPDDILFALTTSGSSINIINALYAAKQKNMKVILLNGNYSSSKIKNLIDAEISVIYNGYSDRIQEIHIKVIHIIILLIEKLMSKKI
ncbi:D-sedoheptulose 7-phosphate isomerase [Enterobacteriaceae endosymbiont of Plateumaris consimilis]|uniref:D-sedoheptulose 7-phosphate isomerase n=1 Tax=Enterobacteriaceae endosymbiont of Plateumaris consimilis TaxID=2675794 RepID=UPI001449E773|nr:D-sedoheptulose 7-phosphate isomerase [Enterobacteriaceae endosymbiont of Plateumaris consimilis]QJC28600.1 D-sedoheptulose 7-phosphate isomerase [Enterobacteriaceae endosymbiont of Plateumaris consimilis]